MRSIVSRVAIGAALLGALLAPSVASAREPTVDVIKVTGLIDAPSTEYLIDRLERAESDGIEAAVIQLDTAGGLDVRLQDILDTMTTSQVPVVVWIAPGTAQARSAGTFIAYGAHLVYMASASRIGGALPVNLASPDDETSNEADGVGLLEELALRSGRDAFFDTVGKSAVSLASTEAVEQGVANGEASSLDELLRMMDGERVTVGDGDSVTLETWDEAGSTPTVRYRFQEMGLTDRLLHAVTDPELAFFLLLLGAFGIIFELYNPGIGLAGIIGAVCLTLAFYSLSALPTNWVGVLLIVAAILALLIDVQTAGLGVFTALGLGSLVVGGLVIFGDTEPALALSPWAVASGVILTIIFFVSVMTAALRVRLRRPISGQEAIIGTIAEAKTDIAPEGTVLTKGTLWRARTMETGIAAGAKVKVMATEGIVLLVEPLHDHGDGSPEGSTSPADQARRKD